MSQLIDSLLFWKTCDFCSIAKISLTSFFSRNLPQVQFPGNRSPWEILLKIYTPDFPPLWFKSWFRETVRTFLTKSWVLKNIFVHSEWNNITFNSTEAPEDADVVLMAALILSENLQRYINILLIIKLSTT